MSGYKYMSPCPCATYREFQYQTREIEREKNKDYACREQIFYIFY